LIGAVFTKEIVGLVDRKSLDGYYFATGCLRGSIIFNDSL